MTLEIFGLISLGLTQTQFPAEIAAAAGFKHNGRGKFHLLLNDYKF
jgi:hypothetical protein